MLDDAHKKKRYDRQLRCVCDRPAALLARASRGDGAAHAVLRRAPCRARKYWARRMWGEHGQDALERCTLCLVNGSATGTEALKNLVLPGASRA